MNAIGIALLWCIVQVTLLGLLAGALYLIVQRIRPGAGAAVALSGLLAVVVLSALALSPWPRWSLDPTSRSRTDFQSVPENNRTDLQSVHEKEDGLEIRPTPGDHATGDRLENGQDSAVSTAVSLWRAFLDGVSQAQPASEGPAWGWPAVVAVVVLAGMATGLAWLLLGLLSVRSHRARSRPLEDAALLALVNQLRAELGCRRPVELRESDDLVTAATIGALRPCILLPRDWASWTDDQRRAVLAHEMAHVRRNDFLAVLAGQLGVVLHFYHPLLHWLMGRLRLEQELAADAAAAGVSGGQRKYLVTIAELALRQQDRSLAWPARTFLPTRTTFLRRITMLRDSKLRLERLSTPLRIIIVAAVAACGLLVAGLRSPGVSSPAQAADAKKPAPAADASIDTTFFTENAAAIIVTRPAVVLARPEVAELAKALDESGNFGLKAPYHLSDMSQITTIMPDPAPPMGRRTVMVFQSAKALNVAPQPDVIVKEYEGKKMHVSYGGKGGAALQYDEHTVIEAGSDAGMVGYLSSKRGVLPKWLPAKDWESFRGDHFVMAADGEVTRAVISSLVEQKSPFIRKDAAPAPLGPVSESATFLATGARLGDRLTVHAAAGTTSAVSAANVARTIEAVKVLAQTTAKTARTQVTAMPEPRRAAVLGLLDLGDALIANLKIHQDADRVRLETSAELRTSLKAIVPAIAVAHEAAKRVQSMNNLKLIAIAIQDYEIANKRLPPAVLYGPDGKTPYSWRVALLPLLGQNDLYKRYRFDEPWDGPNNGKLLSEIPSFYRSPADLPTSTNAAYFPLVGPRTVFAPGETVTFGSIRDGTSNTILFVEAKRDIPWTKPEDIPFDPDKPLPPLGGFFQGVFNAVLCDASVHTFRSDIPQSTLRLLIIKDDGQVTDWSKFQKP